MDVFTLAEEFGVIVGLLIVIIASPFLHKGFKYLNDKFSFLNIIPSVHTAMFLAFGLSGLLISSIYIGLKALIMKCINKE
jgi:hypothetical protein